MRLIIIIVLFVATLGAIFLFGGFGSQINESDKAAQIIAQLEQSSPQVSVTTSFSKKHYQNKTPPSLYSLTTTSSSPSLSPIADTTIPTPSSSLTKISTPTPSPTIISTPAPTQTPIPTSAPTPQPSTDHIYYTSSHWKAKYYYCDTDKEWRDLSSTYLKSFNSSEELLVKYPARILHAPCQ